MKREGFTLVELLIVIVVIGILGTMIMLSSTEAVTSSRASNVISNLRNFKAAALALYSDSIDSFIKEPNTPEDLKAYVLPYMQSGNTIPDDDKFYVRNFNGKWYVFYKVGEDTDSDKARLASKIHGRAKSAGLLGFDQLPTAGATTVDENEYVKGVYVAMRIR